MILYGLYRCALGILVIGCEQDRVVSIKLTSQTDLPHHPCAASELAALQLQEYCDGTRKEFDFPISLSGTLFQTEVWHALGQIPYGETRTYSQIASIIGKPKAARAVGQAVNRNPLWIVIPCHRVIGKDQKLTGYAGGLDLKQALLDLERKHS